MNAANKNNSFGSTLLSSFLMVALVATFSFGLVHTAHAQDDGYDYSSDSGSYYDDGTTYSGGCCDYSYTPDTSYSYTPDSSYSYTPDSSYSYTPDTSEYTYTPDSGYTYTPDSTYTYTPDTASSYDSGSSFGISLGAGVSTRGYSYPTYTYPAYTYPTYSYPTYASPSNSNTNVNTNTNTTYTSNYCSGSNVCNTTSTAVTNPTPVVVTQPVYQPVYQQPVAVVTPVPVSNNPYVSLSQIPYTGLELGFWGTIAYWGFLIFWCLFAAYLIAVKRIQNKFVSFLFGEKDVVPVTVAAHQTYEPTITHAPVHVAYAAPVARANDSIDPFIMSQIQNRAHA